MGRGRRVLLGAGVVLALVVGAVGVVLVQRADVQDLAPRSEGRLDEFLAPWFETVREAEHEPAVVAVVGDSISEGSMVQGDVLRQRATQVLQVELRSAIGSDDASPGFVAPYWADQLSPENVTRTGPPATEQRFAPWGLGGRSLAMPGGSALTYPQVPATSVRVGFGQTTVAGGQGRVVIDGVDVTAAGTVESGPPKKRTSRGSAATLNSAGATSASGLWWVSPELSPGPHEVRVESVAQGFSFVHTGLEFRGGDGAAGVRVLDASAAGATTAEFATSDAAQGHWNELAVQDPDLVLVNLGTNPDPDFEDNLRTVVGRALDAAPHARVLVLDGYEPGTWSHQAWQEVREARRRVVAEHPDRVELFDLAARWPTLAKDGTTSEGLMADVPPVHPSPAGHLVLGEILARLLTPPELGG